MLQCWAALMVNVSASSLVKINLRAIHRAGQVAFQGAVRPICLLDAAILTSSSRRNAILGRCMADAPARCFAREIPNDRMTTLGVRTGS